MHQVVLEEAVALTDPIFEKELTLPEPPIHFKDKIDALKEAELPRQQAACIFDMRKWQAKQLGFQSMEGNTIVRMLMGESYNKHRDGDRHEIEWLYNHHNDKVEKTWGGNAIIYSLVEKKGLWYLPPFQNQVKWEVQSGRLDYLKRELPYGVILRINELKKLKLFNAFRVYAPMDAWFKQIDIDPIVVGEIFLMPPDDNGKYVKTADSESYFIASW